MMIDWHGVWHHVEQPPVLGSSACSTHTVPLQAYGFVGDDVSTLGDKMLRTNWLTPPAETADEEDATRP